MFIDPTNNPSNAQAISAVKALRIAASQGQRIYQISQRNKGTALQALHLDAHDRSEIIAALEAGMEVITHTDPLNVAGWTGAGYILLDPETGEGSYKISGGLNGSFYFGVAVGSLLFLSLAFIAIGTFGAAIALSIAFHATIFWILDFIVEGNSVDGQCFATGMLTALAAIAVFGFIGSSILPLLGFTITQTEIPVSITLLLGAGSVARLVQSFNSAAKSVKECSGISFLEG